MANFGNLKQRVLDIVVDTPTVVQNSVPNLVNAAVRRAQQHHNYQVMETQHTVTTTAGSHLLGNLPANWKARRDRPWMRLGQDGVLRTKFFNWVGDEDDVIEAYDVDDPNDKGEPEVLFERAPAGTALVGTLEVYPFPDNQSLWTDGNYRLVVPYWRYTDAFTNDSQTNWFSENMEDYIVYQAASDAFGLNFDEERATLYAGKAEIERQRSLKLDKRAKLTKNPVVMQPRDGPFAHNVYRGYRRYR